MITDSPAPANDPLRLILVAASPLARMGLAGLLAGQDGLEVVAQSAADDQLPLLLHEEAADLLLWDVDSDTDFDLMAHLGEAAPIVALLRDEQDALEVWQAGALALLPQDIDLEALFAALQSSFNGLLTLDPSFAEALLPRDMPPSPAPATDPTLSLTPREQEVIQLIAQGIPNKGIAQQLSISEHTVKFHVTAIMSKLGAQSRTEAVVRATQQGLLIL